MTVVPCTSENGHVAIRFIIREAPQPKFCRGVRKVTRRSCDPFTVIFNPPSPPTGSSQETSPHRPPKWCDQCAMTFLRRGQ